MDNIAPEISVIVPIYNVENIMDKCVESLVRQTFTNIEILLIDDGSTDSSPAKCEEWAQKDSRIRVFHKNNGGVSSARNQGIKKATGERIVFVDSDDWLDVNTFQYIMDNYENYDLVIWNFADYYEDGTVKAVPFSQVQFITKSVEDLDKLKRYGFAGEDENGHTFNMGLKNIWNRSIKRKILTDNHLYFNEKLKNHEDFLFALLTYEYVQNVAIIDKPFYCRYIRNGSASRSFNKAIHANNRMAYNTMNDFIGQFHGNDQWYQNSVKQYYTGWFFQILSMNYLHRESEFSFWEAYKKTELLINEMPYRESFNYELSHSSIKKKLFCFLGKRRMVFLMCLICKFM